MLPCSAPLALSGREASAFGIPPLEFLGGGALRTVNVPGCGLRGTHVPLWLRGARSVTLDLGSPAPNVPRVGTHVVPTHPIRFRGGVRASFLIACGRILEG